MVSGIEQSRSDSTRMLEKEWTEGEFQVCITNVRHDYEQKEFIRNIYRFILFILRDTLGSQKRKNSFISTRMLEK